MSVSYPIDNYFNRHDETKHYEKHLVRAGYGTQSAEINEIQEAQIARIKGIGDVLFKDGDIIRDCQAVVNDTTGNVQMSSGALYLRGAVRGVAPATFTIPVNTIVNIGVRLTETVVTELQDPALRDPATGTRNYDEPGAGRLQVTIAWGWDGDGGTGDFFGVYTVDNGILLGKEAPPAFDGVSNAIARYDRDSAGGRYIIEGLSVSSEYDRVNEKLIVLVGEGRARANGFAIEIARGIRLNYDADPDIKAITAEPKTFTPDGTGKMRIELDNGPLLDIEEVRITAQKTVAVTHGAFAGASDPLPDNSILALIEVKQGATTYTPGTDYLLTSGEVNWSPGGAEPAPGSSYTVKYNYQSTTAGIVTLQDDTGYTLEGAVAGSVVTTDYTFALPRIDAIVLDQAGRIQRTKGVASQYAPAAPVIPDTQLRLASLSHDWFGDPTVSADAVMVMPMDELQSLKGMVFDLFDLVAQERLRNAISLSDPAAKRGVFVDPFTNDDLRDQGITQELAIIDGELMLAIDPTVQDVATSITAPELLPYTLEVIVEQPFRTGNMKINPYQAFDPLPLSVNLSPGVDFWTETVVVWASEITRRFMVNNGTGAPGGSSSSTVQTLSTREKSAEFLRPIEVHFTAKGFGAGEVLSQVYFDGISVTPELP